MQMSISKKAAKPKKKHEIGLEPPMLDSLRYRTGK